MAGATYGPLSNDERQRSWANWLRNQLDIAGWTAGELISRAQAAGTPFSKSAVSRWLNAQQIPSSQVVFDVAKVLGTDPREAFEAAGYRHLMGMAGDVVVSADPAEAFVQRIRARGFPSEVEERLIAHVRAEIEERRRALEATLDTVTEAIAVARNAS